MKRSVKIFSKAGFDFLAYPCDYKVVPEKNTIENTLIPSIKVFYEWKDLLKEMVGLVVYQITGKA